MKSTEQKNRKWFIMITIVAAVCVTVLVVLVATGSSRKFLRLLDLGKKYLEDGEYNQAVTSFDEALEIKPQNEDVLQVMADTYLAWANKEFEQVGMDPAERLLEEGYLKTKDTRLSDRLEEIRSVAAETKEPETENVEDTDVKKEMVELLEVKGEDYEYVGYAYGGVIPVYKNSKWGAISYDGTEIIPCKYDNFHIPNDDGYIVMINGSDNPEYTLFDNTGKVIYQGTDHVVASNGFYIVAHGQEENGLTNTIIDYYRYGGDLVVSVDTQSPSEWGVSWEPHGFYDGLSLVERNIGDTVYSRANFMPIMPFEVGFVDETGGVDWHDGDGFDEKDSSVVMGAEEYAGGLAEKSADSTNGGYYGTAYGAASVANESVPMNSLNNGYYLGYYEFSGERVLRDKDRIVAGFMMDMITLQGDTLAYGKDSISINGNTVPMYGGAAEGTYYDENRILSYPSDGDYYYNYGSKILMLLDGKYVLMDLLSPGELKYDVFDYCAMNDEKYWLVQKGDQWGYIDHEGEVKRFFDDASAFHNGLALIIENQTAYMVDENFEKKQELGEADSVFCSGEIFGVRIGDDERIYLAK